MQTWVAHHPPAMRHKVARIVRQSGVDNRYTVRPLAETLLPHTLTNTMDDYRNHLITLGEQVLGQALRQANVPPPNVDCLITVSCTGYLAPSLGAYLIDRLGLKPETYRLPVTEMGCGGGAAGLLYAHQYLKANPDHTVAVVCVELCSLTFQREDFSWANIISTALFGDGAACVLFGPSQQPGLCLIDGGMSQLPNSQHLLGFNLTDTGFSMVLDPSIPAQVEQAFWPAVTPLLNRQALQPSDVSHWIVHPGGRLILDRIAALLVTPDETTAENPLHFSYEVLRQYGNVSSATVLFILQRMLESNHFDADPWLWLGAFGPGFTTSQVLLKWTC